MAFKNFTAKFSDGVTIDRRSEYDYTHAWKLTANYNGGVSTMTGFASSERLANAAKMANCPKEWNKQKRRWQSLTDRIISFEVVKVGA